MRQIATGEDAGIQLTPSQSLNAPPRLRWALPSSSWHQLSSAVELARETIRTKPACAALFQGLRADALALLMSARFAPATTRKDYGACERGVIARAEFGGDEIRLCPVFAALSKASAARVVLHELLHAGGMSEKPHDPKGLTSQEISQLVRARCLP